MAVSINGKAKTIGIALSGGGFRAAAFHLGVFTELRALNLLDKLDLLTCVSGGSIAGGDARFSELGSVNAVTIQCRPLLQILDDSGITRPDVLKIDIEGAEDLALRPFLENAADERLPRRLIVENSDALWKIDLRAAITARGYQSQVRSRLNTVYAR
jgi:hypothetical protein